MIQIREAERSDIPAISDLYRQLVHPVAPETEFEIRADQIDAVRADPHNFLFVLETVKQVCGSAFLTLCLDPMHGNEPYALLEHFFIERSYPG